MTVSLDTRKEANMTGVATNGSATLTIPTGGTLYNMYLHVQTAAGADVALADIKSELDSIVLRINGDLIYDVTPTFMLDRQEFYGASKNANNRAGVIPFFFARNNLNPVQSSVFALGTQGVSSIQLEVKCGTLVNIAKIGVTTERSAEVRPLGQHVKINRFAQNFGTTGMQEIATLPKTPLTGLLTMYVEDNTGTIDDMSVVTNGNSIVDEVDTAVQAVRLERSGRTPQTGYYITDFNSQNSLEDYLDMTGVEDFRLKVNWSGVAPNNFNIYLERIAGLSPATV